MCTGSVRAGLGVPDAGETGPDSPRPCRSAQTTTKFGAEVKSTAPTWGGRRRESRRYRTEPVAAKPGVYSATTGECDVYRERSPGLVKGPWHKGWRACSPGRASRGRQARVLRGLGRECRRAKPYLLGMVIRLHRLTLLRHGRIPFGHCFAGLALTPWQTFGAALSYSSPSRAASNPKAFSRLTRSNPARLLELHQPWNPW